MPAFVLKKQNQDAHLVEEFLAKGGEVQKIEPGRSAWETIEGVSISPGQHRTIRQKMNQVIDRRKAIRKLVVAGVADKDIHAAFKDEPVGVATLAKDITWVRQSADIPNPGRVRPHGRVSDEARASMARQKQERAVVRQAKVRELVAKGLTRNDIIAELRSSYQTITRDLNELGLIPKGSKVGRKQRSLTGSRKPKSTAENPQDRRRFKETIAPTGKSSSSAPAEATGTIFPKQVFDAPDNPLRDGKDQRKLGGDVLVGHLKGYRLLHLSLEERATCPSECMHWRTCYGNNMQYAKRWRHGPELENAIKNQVSSLMRHDRGVLVRLHTLGDFYSENYAAMWGRLVAANPLLAVFGFTAHGPDTKIGGKIAKLRTQLGRRFSIRHSGHDLKAWGSITMERLAHPGETTHGQHATICPEQRHALEGRDSCLHCGSCGLCWKAQNTIAFMRH